MLQISNKLVGSGGTTVKGVGIELSVILVKLVMWSVTIKQNRTTFNHCLIYSHKLIINDHALKAKSCWKKKLMLPFTHAICLFRPLSEFLFLDLTNADYIDCYEGQTC